MKILKYLLYGFLLLIGGQFFIGMVLIAYEHGMWAAIEQLLEVLFWLFVFFAVIMAPFMAAAGQKTGQRKQENFYNDRFAEGLDEYWRRQRQQELDEYYRRRSSSL